MTRLTTARLALAPMAEADFDDVRAMWGDPDFVRPLFPAPLGGEEVWTRLLRDIGHWRVRGYGNWAVRRREDGAFVGAVGVLDYRRDLEPRLDAPELGWGVAPRWQGQGLAQEAVRAALDWCDAVLAAPRTVCIIDPGNTPSLRLAAKTGYRPLHTAVFRDRPIAVLERPRP